MYKVTATEIIFNAVKT